jgi:plasmid stabilization system protein ParE
VSGYVLSADADFDLDAIWEYIAADDIGAADRWVGKLFDAFEALGQTHRAWATGARISPGIRSCSGLSELTSSSIAPSGVRLK